MIRATFGFDTADTAALDLQWDILNGTWYNFSTAIAPGVPGPPNSGSAGQSAEKWFGVGMFTRVFSAQTTWVVGFDWQLGNHGPNGLNQFLQLSYSGGVILSLEMQLSGAIAVKSGGGTNGTGTTVAMTSTPYLFTTTGVWLGYLELRCTGFGGAVNFSLWLNDVQILAGSAGFGINLPDRVTMGSQGSGGMQYDNVYMLDGQGVAPLNDRLGPIRITSLIPASDAAGNWIITPSSFSYRYQAVQEPPDVGATHYITPPLIHSIQSFSTQPSPCFGLVLGVMVNTTFRGSTGSTTCDAVYVNGATVVTIGSSVVNGPFHNQQQFLSLSPASGTNFTDFEISGSLWGASSASPFLQLTQFWLEKITSLRNVPYNCGLGSYSF